MWRADRGRGLVWRLRRQESAQPRAAEVGQLSRRAGAPVAALGRQSVGLPSGLIGAPGLAGLVDVVSGVAVAGPRASRPVLRWARKALNRSGDPCGSGSTRMTRIFCTMSSTALVRRSPNRSASSCVAVRSSEVDSSLACWTHKNVPCVAYSGQKTRRCCPCCGRLQRPHSVGQASSATCHCYCRSWWDTS
jgi:hypothetical protein